jgi:hypothetical protein
MFHLKKETPGREYFSSGDKPGQWTDSITVPQATEDISK